MSNDKYFAADEAEETVSYLHNKSQTWFDGLNHNKYLDKLRRSWQSYHGSYYQNGHEITFGGESGELVNLAINHYRNIASHMLTMITAQRPAFQARSINTDYKSQVQTQLANGLLEYYLREKRLESYLKRAVEYSIVLGAGYVKMEWNATAGEIYDYIEPEYDEDETDETKLKPFPIYEGDVQFTNLSPFDVVFDSTKETSQDHDWVLCRSFKNKYDLMAKYPDYKDEILGLQTKSDQQRYRVALSALDETVDVAVYEFFHKKTESMPNGRYLLYLSTDIVLMDTPMPYRRLPIYRISPGDILGTPFGYTPMFDLLPIQDGVNSLYSTIMTNNNAFGVQNVLNPRGNDVRVNQLAGGLNFIEYNATVAGGASGKPESLQMTQSSPETFNFIGMLEQAMETISGINSVARGNPESSLKSGTALALVQSQALEFISGLQQSYIMLIEDVGTGLVELLQDFAKVPRVAEISGKTNKSKMKEFSSSDIDSIKRVVVDVGNAMSQCLGKDTPVLMYDGSTKVVQNIKKDDLLMGPDSKPRTVKSTTRGRQEMFEVKSKTQNVKYECNLNHILTLRYCSDNSRYNVKSGDILDIAVKDYIELPSNHKRLLQGFTTGVEFEKKETEIPAYILGLWLGNEESKAPTISDKHLNSLNLIQNKHIPEKYIINNKETRLDLLAGLLDSDGTLTGEAFSFSQKDEKLVDQVIYLSKSLGFKVTKKLSNGITNFGKGKMCKVIIEGNTHIIPTKLLSKQVLETEKNKEQNSYEINVSSLGRGDYFGFSLEEEPHFLLGDFTVTHNTTAGRVEMANNLIQMGLITTPEQYFSVMNTGNLQTMTEGSSNQNLLVRAENEKLTDGTQEVIATAIDKHSLHIKEHMNILADPDLRLDTDLTTRVLAHIQEHIDLLHTTDPNLLAMIGEQPLSPPGGSPISQESAEQPQPNQQGSEGIPQGLANPEAESVAVQAGPLPQPAEPPIDPATGQPLVMSERPMA